MRRYAQASTPYLLVAIFVFLLGFVTTRPAQPVYAQASGPGFVPLINGWNISSVTSGSRILTTNAKPTQAASIVRISVVLGSSVPLSIYETDGTHTFTSALNGGSALTAGCCYTFVFGTRNAAAPGGSTQSGAGGATVTTGALAGTTPASFNFVVGGPTTVPILRVDECIGGVE